MTKTSKDDSEPVDAEFKSVSDSEAAPGRGGGGYLGGLILFVLATLAGGTLGAWGAQFVMEPRPAYDDAQLAEQVMALETRLSGVESGEPAAAESDLEALRQRIEALESAPLADPADPEALSALTARVEALETAIPAETGTDPALTARLDRIESQAGRAETLANQALELPAAADPASILSLEDRISDLESAETPAPVDLSDLEARLAALETASATMSEDRVAALEARISAAEDAATAAGSATDETASARSLAARTLALIALTEIAETGQSFEAERAALVRLWPDRDELAALRPMARAGVPTADSLTASFPGEAIRAAAGEQRAFFGLVEVRRTDGTSEGDSPQALTRLAEARLARGDLEGAVAAVSRLEGDPAEAAQAWLLTAEARLTVNDSLTALRAALARDAGLEE